MVTESRRDEVIRAVDGGKRTSSVRRGFIRTEGLKPVLLPLGIVYIAGYLLLVGVVAATADALARPLFSTLIGFTLILGGVVLLMLLVLALWVRITEEYQPPIKR
jgi:hypothetical protein